MTTRILLLVTVLAIAGVSEVEGGWMADYADVLANRTLAQITFAGTHDSGTNNLTNNPQPGYSTFLDEIYTIANEFHLDPFKLANDWAQSQDTTITQQLEAGIRFFDLRAGWNGTDWLDFHMIDGAPLEALVDEIAYFLATNDKEIVIARVTELTGNFTLENQLELANMLQTNLGDFLIPVGTDLGNTTVGTLVKESSRALFTLYSSVLYSTYSFPLIWDDGTVLDSYADTPDLDKMISFNSGIVNSFNSAPSYTYTSPYGGPLSLMSWTLTPDAATVVEGFLPGAPHTLLDLADKANGALGAWALLQASEGNCLTNVFIIDHFETSNVVNITLDSTLNCNWPSWT